MKVTCTKLYQEYPFAHRQHLHAGHCSLIHGHNWDFEFAFEADNVDDNGFVVDFGRLKWIKVWLDDHFDHTLVLNEGDPFLEDIKNGLTDVRFDPNSPSSIDLAKIVEVPNGGAEGIAQLLLGWVNDRLTNGWIGADHSWPELKKRNVRCTQVRVWENSRNSATAVV